MAKTDYDRKRDFKKTPEPGGGKQKRKSGKEPIFVIQEHDASSHHFDFRIEVGGALKSWAVPKGLSTDPKQKRLAIPTEDHPMDYADFEGVIPQDQYGGGSVIVWDTGPYHNITEKDGKVKPIEKSLEDGHLLIWLQGSKLQGGWALQRTNMGGDDNWLIVKMKDAGADARRNPVSTEPESVLSGRTVGEVAAEEGDG